MRRKEASAHHCSNESRTRSVSVARTVSYLEGMLEKCRNLRGKAGGLRVSLHRSVGRGHPGLSRLVCWRITNVHC